MKKKNVLEDKPYFYSINDIEGLDVDNPIDVEIAEYLHKKHF